MDTFKQFYEQQQKGVDESDSGGEQLDLGYNLDAIEDLMRLFDQHGMRQGEHFVPHVGYGDDLPNAVTIHNDTLARLRPEQIEEIRATAQASHDENEYDDEDFQGEYGDRLD